MGIRCKLFGCKKFVYKGQKVRECVDCKTEYIFVEFYPNRPADWIEKSFVDHWKTYDNLINTPMRCEACDNLLDNKGKLFNYG